MRNDMIRNVCSGGLLAALYVVTTAINPIGYGIVQLRLSAVISILPFYRKEYRIPCILAVAVANMFSPLGIMDVLTGVLLWTLAYYIISSLKNIWAVCAVTAILSGVLIGTELSLILKAPFLWNLISITVSQMIVFSMGVKLWARILSAHCERSL